MLEDLYDVGAKKAVGFMTLDMVRHFAPLEEVLAELTARGLKTFITDERQCWNQTASLYAYDELMLEKLLAPRREFLQSQGWPVDPEGFVKKMSATWAEAKTPLYDLVADAFGNKADFGRTDVAIPEDIDDPYWQRVKAATESAARTSYTPR